MWGEHRTEALDGGATTEEQLTFILEPDGWQMSSHSAEQL